MDINRILMDDHPVWNQKVDQYLQELPLYVSYEHVPVHQKKLHVQPGVELNVSHEGKAALVVGSRVYMQTPRNLSICFGEMPHQLFPDPAEPYRRTVLCLHDAGLKAAASMAGQLDLEWLLSKPCTQFELALQTYTTVVRILQKMDRELRLLQPGWRAMTVSLFLELVASLQRNDTPLTESNKAYDTSGGSVASDLIRICCEHIEQYLFEDLPLKETAKLFHVSPEHLTRLFRKEKGMSYYRYLLGQRVLRSKQMMKQHPEISMTEIACSLGFSSPTQFSRVFKSIVQVTPTEYREQLKQTSPAP